MPQREPRSWLLHRQHRHPKSTNQPHVLPRRTSGRWIDRPLSQRTLRVSEERRIASTWIIGESGEVIVDPRVIRPFLAGVARLSWLPSHRWAGLTQERVSHLWSTSNRSGIPVRRFVPRRLRCALRIFLPSQFAVAGRGRLSVHSQHPVFGSLTNFDRNLSATVTLGLHPLVESPLPPHDSHG